MKIENRAELRISRVHPPDTSGISHHRLQFLPNDRFSVGQVDGVAVAFAHFSAVGARHFRELRQVFFRLGKDRLFVEIVESSRHFTRQLQVRELIFPHRDEIGFVQENIGCLQHGIAEKAVGASDPFP